MKNIQPSKDIVFTDGNGIITSVVFASIAGKKYKAKAKHNPEDKYNYELGIQIATMRLNQKILKDKIRRHKRKVQQVMDAYDKEIAYHNKLIEKYIELESQERDLA